MTTTHKATAATLIAALALAVLMLFASTASADFRRGDDGGDSTTVENTNSATVNNTVEIEAETGDNTARGDDGGRGGYGGDARGDGAIGGDGGNGGRGGDGGTVTTGAATAFGDLLNDVNYNLTEIEGCGCDDDEGGWNPFFFFGRDRDQDDGGDRIRVENDNSATVNNDFEVEAETGDNNVSGDDGGKGGSGGDASMGHDRQRTLRSFSLWFNWWDDDEAVGGAGGNGGAGGAGGTVRTGEAYADGVLTNYVNHNITRIDRGDADEEVEE